MVRQILQSLDDGRTILADVPVPQLPAGGLLIQTTRTLISAGTERMLLEFGRAGWLDRIRQQPDKARQVLEKLHTDGLIPTIEAVRSTLDRPLPLGYCNVGVVTAVGSDVRGFARGDRVASNGPHAECVAVPRNLCARVPDDVPDDDAAFTVLGAIALQGVRLAAPTLGERFVVIGLGLVGLLAVQLLRANGCRVLGMDPDPTKCELARRFGAQVVAHDRGEDALAVSEAFTGGQGVDGVLITAATASNEPVAQAARMSRKRGRIVLVGVVGLELNRADFYQKELSFQVSCSYGPGRYDSGYEEKGNDYPLGFVRWTEQRNFQAVLDLLAAGSLDVKPLITHRFAFDSAPAAYELLATVEQPYLGILLDYAADPRLGEQTRIAMRGGAAARTAGVASPGVAFIGAGNYAGRVLIPAFAATGVQLRAIASSGGVTAAHCGRKFGFATATTDPDSLIADKDIDVVVVATRHDTHARFVLQSIRAGKPVFVEKPLAISATDVDSIADAWSAADAAGSRPQVMVGFNRRFAPHVVRMKSLLSGLGEPKSIIVTVNAGALPASHWAQDSRVGGGRIVGEACHFVDLTRFLAGHPIVESRLEGLGSAKSGRSDSATILLRFADGSTATIHYLANGHRSFAKERVEVFCAGRILQLDNFRRLRGYGWKEFGRMNLWRQDKGQTACVRAFVDAIREGRESPIPFDEVIEVSRVSSALGEAALG